MTSPDELRRLIANLQHNPIPQRGNVTRRLIAAMEAHLSMLTPPEPVRYHGDLSILPAIEDEWTDEFGPLTEHLKP